MARYRVACRGMLGPATVAKLTQAGVYWTRGGLTELNSESHRRHLLVEASDEASAAEAARAEVEAAGGARFDVDVLGEYRDLVLAPFSRNGGVRRSSPDGNLGKDGCSSRLAISHSDRNATPVATPEIGSEEHPNLEIHG